MSSSHHVAKKSAGRRKSPKQHRKDLFDYILLITPVFNERKKQTVTYVAVRTVKEFTNFRYELVADADVKDRTIRIDIKGLRAPELTLPDVGPAVFETEFDDLNGRYELIVRKLEKDVNVFHVKISPEKIVLQKSHGKRFAEVVTRKEDW